MDTKSAYDPLSECCPMMDMECPRGSDSALDCQQRVDGDFNPLQNFRDLAIVNCAAERQAQMRRMNELPPLV